LLEMSFHSKNLRSIFSPPSALQNLYVNIAVVLSSPPLPLPQPLNSSKSMSLLSPQNQQLPLIPHVLTPSPLSRLMWTLPCSHPRPAYLHLSKLLFMTSFAFITLPLMSPQL
jgi:hypothetical protein